VNTKIALLVVALSITTACFADPVNPLDPKMIIGTGSGSIPIKKPNFIITLIVNPGQNGQPSFGISQSYRNATGAPIRSLTVTPPPGAYSTTTGVPNTCGITLPGFTVCSAPQGNGGSWFFSGAVGLPPDADLTISVIGFVPGTWEFGAVDSPNFVPIPEPASILLLVPGVFGLLRLKRSW